MDQLLGALIAAAPEIEALRTEHLRDNEELLPHVLFGDVTRWLAEHQPQPAALQVLEEAFLNGDYYARDLIAASFVYNIEPGPDHEELREALGPALLALWKETHV